MLIDHTYFVREIFVAQRSQLEVREELDLYIKVEEPKYLRRLLGGKLYEDFTAGLALDPIPEQWAALRDVLVYPDTLVSPIANFVYCAFSEDNITQTTGVGELLPLGENGDKASPVIKIVRAWNSMVDLTCEIHKKIQELNLDDYPHQDRRCICEEDYYCGCKHDAVFGYRNRFGF